MAENETRVVYKAIADFTALNRVLRTAKKNLKDLRKEEDELNKDSIAGSAAATMAKGRHVKAISEEVAATAEGVTAKGRHTKALDAETAATTSQVGTVRQGTVAFLDNAKAAKDAAAATDSVTDAVKESVAANKESVAVTKEATGVAKGFEQVLTRRALREREAIRNGTQAVQLTRRQAREQERFAASMTNATDSATRLNRGLIKIKNWRPRLIPPFIALIPIIGSVLALINPLVAGIGALGIAGYALASSFASIGGAAIGIIPALATLFSLVASIKTAFGGVGNVFKQATAAREAAGQGSGGAPARAEISQAEEIARANEDYARSIEDVRFAQEDLDETRKGYILRLKELQKAVDRAAASEARAAANSQLARENYANILADPGSTKGAKMDAKVGVDEAGQAVVDVVDENKQNASALLQAQQDGIDGDQQVIMAKRRLVDAIDSQRDAEIALTNARSGANRTQSASAKATDEYQKALDKLSPSARAVVLNLLSMRGAYEAMQRTVQEAFFSEVVDSVGLLNRLFPVMTGLLSNAAGAAGRVADNFLRLVTSDQWLKDLGIIGEQNVPIIESIGDGILYILDSMKDLAIIAGPFLTTLSEGFKEGSENFRDMVAGARESGSLAAWLEDVRENMSQWWRIIKNLATSLFNLGTATAPLGKWLTDAFEKTTSDWVKATEAAGEAGSPFQVFLKNIEPLLTEINALLGDFFSWFGREASSEDNITQMTEILRIIREELGPALGSIFDTLSEAGVGESLILALTSIVEFIDDLLKQGGIEGITAFFETIQGLFDAGSDFFGIFPEGSLGWLFKGFGILAALTFVGLTGVLGLLIQFATLRGVGRLFKGVAGSFKGLKNLGKGKPDPAASGTTAAASGKPASGRRAAPKPGFFSKFGSDRGSTSVGTSGKMGLSVLKGLGVGLAVGLVNDAIIQPLADKIEGNGKNGAANVGANALAGAGTGSLIGSGIGSLFGPAGALIGAAAGGAIGGAAGALSSDQADLNEVNDAVNKWLEDLFTVWIPEWFTSMAVSWTDGIEVIKNWWNDEVIGAWLRGVEVIKQWWNDYVVFPFQTAIAMIRAGWENNVVIPFQTAVALIRAGWHNFVVIPFQTAVAVIRAGWELYVVAPFKAAVAVIRAGWELYVVAPFKAAIASIQSGWTTYVTEPFDKAITAIKKAWDKFLDFDLGEVLAKAWGFLTGGGKDPAGDGGGKKPKGGSTAAKVRSILPPGARITSTYRTEAENRAVGGVANSYHKDKNNPAVDIAGSVSVMNAVHERLKAIGGWRELLYKVKGHFDHIHVANTGGTVPGRGNGDTVPSMLTPGEFVVRKAIVNRVGPENLERFNSGVMSYAQLLQSGMAAASGPAKNKNSDLSYFNAGGLVPSLGMSSFSGGTSVTPASFDRSGSDATGAGFHVEQLIVNNPVPETASESLPKSIRKLAYLGGER